VLIAKARAGPSRPSVLGHDAEGAGGCGQRSGLPGDFVVPGELDDPLVEAVDLLLGGPVPFVADIVALDPGASVVGTCG